jgi:hypothetical protein
MNAEPQHVIFGTWGMRLIIQPWPADVSGRGVLEELFFDRVAVEPGDGAQPSGDGGAGAALASRSRAKPSMSARRTANKPRERARHQVVNWRGSSESAMRVAARRSSCYGRCCWRQESRLDGLPAVIGCPAAQWVNG